MAITIGRLCIKIAGRDAGKKAVVVDILDKNFVMIDGEVRRKRCNILHLEPLNEVIDLKKGASHDDVKAAFKKLKITLKDKKSKPKKDRKKSIRGKKKKKLAEVKDKKGKKVKKVKEKKKEVIKKVNK